MGEVRGVVGNRSARYWLASVDGFLPGRRWEQVCVLTVDAVSLPPLTVLEDEESGLDLHNRYTVNAYDRSYPSLVIIDAFDAIHVVFNCLGLIREHISEPCRKVCQHVVRVRLADEKNDGEN